MDRGLQLTEIQLLEDWHTPTGRLDEAENWYAEPFTKRTACKTPGQCGGDCNCGCPYNTMTELERLPLIAEIEQIFPNEWLAFIISAEEDEELEPTHGKLVAHSPNPDDVYDAVNTVLWNQHVYIYFNGDFEAMQASYGLAWDTSASSVEQRSYSGPKQIIDVADGSSVAPSAEPLPEALLDLIYSAVDKLYGAGTPDLNEAIRRLRLSRVRAAAYDRTNLLPIIDNALDLIEGPLPRVNDVIWFLEEALAEIEDTGEAKLIAYE
ncbi:MAG: hypothetical protein R3264_15050 [Anaerolineae bacterium]|nr:hypothetical protein [Anaerolineae bacterium]